MTTYLSRGVITSWEAARLRLSDRYDWHKFLWKFFPGVDSGTTHEFQWRLDRNEGGFIAWILSESLPAYAGKAGRWATREVAETFLTHERYEFSLCANPTVMRVVRNADGTRKKNGRREAVVNRDELRKWLEDKGREGGFRPLDFIASPPEREYFYKAKGQKGVHSSVEFRGTLEVTDREKFVETWKLGIGSAKGFGFGLLLLKPIA